MRALLKGSVQLCQTINENPRYQIFVYTCFILFWWVHYCLYQTVFGQSYYYSRRHYHQHHGSLSGDSDDNDDDYYFQEQQQVLLQPDDNPMGFTPDQLNQFYNNLGPEGCKAYIRLCIWYLVPFIETVGLVAGMALVEQQQQQQVSSSESGVADSISQQRQQELGLLIPILFVILGFIDKGIQIIGCWLYLQQSAWDGNEDDQSQSQHQHKQVLSNTIIYIASYALIGQWILLISFLATYICWGCKKTRMHCCCWSTNGNTSIHHRGDDEKEVEEGTEKLAAIDSSSCGSSGTAAAIGGHDYEARDEYDFTIAAA